jgi:hypothetical protein
MSVKSSGVVTSAQLSRSRVRIPIGDAAYRSKG